MGTCSSSHFDKLQYENSERRIAYVRSMIDVLNRFANLRSNPYSDGSLGVRSVTLG